MVIHYQVDIVPAAGFYPSDTRAQMAGILGMPVADIRAYTPYSVVAEKLEAMVALFLASSASAYINGAVIPVGGGLTAHSSIPK